MIFNTKQAKEQYKTNIISISTLYSPTINSVLTPCHLRTNTNPHQPTLYPNTNNTPTSYTHNSMATEINGRLRGKLGNRIYYVDPVTGIQRVRQCPKKVRNPRSPLQTGHRGNFGLISHLSSLMSEAYDLGLHHHARRAKLRPYNDFRRLNKDCFTSDGNIDYQRLVLSRGSIPKVYFDHADMPHDNILNLSFDPELLTNGAYRNDKLRLYAFCPALEQGMLFPPVLRSDGSATIELPEEWQQPVHLYAFLLNSRGYASDTIYIPIG